MDTVVLIPPGHSSVGLPTARLPEQAHAAPSRPTADRGFERVLADLDEQSTTSSRDLGQRVHRFDEDGVFGHAQATAPLQHSGAVTSSPPPAGPAQATTALTEIAAPFLAIAAPAAPMQALASAVRPTAPLAEHVALSQALESGPFAESSSSAAVHAVVAVPSGQGETVDLDRPDTATLPAVKAISPDDQMSQATATNDTAFLRSEDGAHLLVDGTGMSPFDRSRLRDRLAATLSSHGYRLAGVLVHPTLARNPFTRRR